MENSIQCLQWEFVAVRRATATYSDTRKVMFRTVTQSVALPNGRRNWVSISGRGEPPASAFLGWFGCEYLPAMG
jgi:hypothetical protein